MMTKPTAVFKPLPWQVEPWKDKSRVLLLTGSAGGGKSRLAGEKVNGVMKKYPGATGLMLRKAREYTGKSIVPFMRRTVIGADPTVGILKSESHFHYANGSVLYWGGMRTDEQREGLRSIGPDGAVDIIWMEEANGFTEDDFNELLARLRGKASPWLQIILGTNPDDPNHWIYKRLIQGGEASVYYSGAVDNKHNPKSYIQTLETLTGVLLLRLGQGKWVHAEGAVYDEYDAGLHLIEPFEIPEDWRRFRSIDFGYSNPFVCQWWAMDPDGRLYLYREIYRTKTLVEDHAKRIIDLERFKDEDGEYLCGDDDGLEYGVCEEIIEKSVADHDAEDRATAARYGVSTTAANKSKSVGIQAVKRRLTVAGDGKPRIYFFRGALVEEDSSLLNKPKTTVEEITGYAWPKATEGRHAKEEPVKKNDHGMDAMRYMVMNFDDGIPAGVDLIGFA